MLSPALVLAAWLVSQSKPAPAPASPGRRVDLGVGGWLAFVGIRGYLYVRQFVAGLDRIAWGMAFFLLATLISLAKAGVLRRWIERKPDPGDRSLA